MQLTGLLEPLKLGIGHTALGGPSATELNCSAAGRSGKRQKMSVSDGKGLSIRGSILK